MKVAGAYLWELRELRKLSRLEVAAKIREQTGEGTNDTQVMRIEKGQPTNPAVLAAFVQIIQGNKETVDALLLDQEATEEAGRRAAKEWFEQVSSNPILQENQRRIAIDLIEALKNDPDRLGRLIGYGRSLLDERQDTNGSQ